MDEQTQAAVDAAKAEVEQAYLDKLKAAEDAQNKILEELKEERKKKQEAEAKLTLKGEDGNPQDVSQTVEDILNKKDKEKLKQTQEDTIKKFKESNPEFHPDNDPGGIKYAAFQKKLARIDTTSLTSQEDLVEVLDDVMFSLKRNSSTDTGTDANPYASTNQQFSSPRSITSSGLNSTEQKLIKSLGWTEERYLKIKKARPTYVANLLKFNS